jgi:phosphate transport system substrate-binding protein
MKTFMQWMASASLLSILSIAPASAQQQQTLFCLSDGTQISAQRFETHDGKFFLYVPGSSTPLEYPVSSVKGINVHCDSGPTPPPAPTPSQAQAQPPAPQNPAGFGIHGSNTIGERLMPMLIEAYSKAKLGSTPTSKMTAAEEQEITLKLADGSTKMIDLKAHGSGTSAPDLMAGKSIVGMSSRRINPKETTDFTARFNTNPQQPGNEHVLALDGVAVIVNPQNPVKQLSLDQIARIFAGQITNWQDVGGANQPINVYRRDDKSGTTDTFKSLVLAGPNLSFSTSAKMFESSETVSSDVTSDPAGIGYIGLPYINKNTPLAISSTCGITSSPSRFTVKTETYPLTRRLYLYTVGVPNDPVARDIVDYALSDQAQATVQEAEFVEQTPDFQDDADQRDMVQGILSDPTRGLGADKEIPREILRGFESIMSNVRRTSAVFRFEYNSSELDTRAQQDVQRIARWLNSPAAAGKKFFITGFADSKGTWRANYDLASKRAIQVARELERAGVRVPRDSVLSLSYMAPTACNDSDAGTAKNRRVEIWVAK